MKEGFDRHLSDEVRSAMAQGRELSRPEVDVLRVRIAEHPTDRIARLMMLGVYGHDEQRTEQVLWFVEHEPWTALGANGIVPTERMNAAWLAALERHANDLRVRENAAWYYAVADPRTAARILSDYCASHATDPNGWELLAVCTDFNTSCKSELADQCLEAAFQVFRLDPFPEQRLSLIPMMRSWCATKPGRTRMLELLEAADQAAKEAEYDSSTRTQLILVAAGFVSVADGNANRALECLRSALSSGLPTESMLALASNLARSRRAEILLLLRATQSGLLEAGQRLRSSLARFDNQKSSTKS